MFGGIVLCMLVLGVAPNANAQVRLKMATTTSTENSGLLDVLLPPFEEKYNINVDVIAVGTGKSLKIAENGDADVVFVHARSLEDRFVAEGYGVNRRDVMHNDFVILGPPTDPAKVKGEKDAAAALKKIADGEAVFVSRGDRSGTYVKELSLWQAAGIEPKGGWYLEVGQGMGATITMANEKQGYTLADRATYLAFRDKIDLRIVCEGDERLYNPYGIIAVNPAKYPHVKYMQAMMLIAWVTSSEGQKIIGEFKKEESVLFYPDAIPNVVK
ncbi:MAG: solute-binding protein [Planctomycetes bacterium]|nr:solute-binding protein [Planctomycetota bacterium]